MSLLPPDIQDEKRKKRSEFCRRNENNFIGQIFYLLIAFLVVFVAASIITTAPGCTTAPNSVKHSPYTSAITGFYGRKTPPPHLRKEEDSRRQEDLKDLRKAPETPATRTEQQTADGGTSGRQETGCEGGENKEEGAAPTNSNENDTPSTPRAEAENFCEDMRSAIEKWRKYLNPDFDWATVGVYSEEAVETRKRNLRRLIEQYDRLCKEQ